MPTFASLLTQVDSIARHGDWQVAITQVTYDSRQVRPGALFVALAGATHNGHGYIAAAIQAGAVAVITEGPLDGIGVAAARVTDARRALSQVARAVHGDPSHDLTLIGVTGTKGKTTTTYMVQAILAANTGTPAFRFGTVSYDLGGSERAAKNTTPESLELAAMLAECRANGTKCGVMEVSSHALLTSRVEDLSFAAAGFMNLSLEHSEFHPDMEHYFAAKSRLFLELPQRDKPCLIMIDDDWGRRLATRLRQGGHRVLTVSLQDPAADVHATEIRTHNRGSEFVLCWQGARHACRLPIPGPFNVGNALMAAGLTLAVGVRSESVVTGLANLKQVPGRFEPVPNDLDLTVIVDYAHSPNSLENVIDAVRQITPGRLITVFGCGGNRSHEKRPVMGRIAAAGSDVTVVTSDNPRKEEPTEIIRQIVAGIPIDLQQQQGRIVVEADRHQAIQSAIDLARPGDTVLIAGKGHESGQTFADRIVPFDDREVARACLTVRKERQHNVNTGSSERHHV